MKLGWMIVALAVLAFVAADSADARAKKLKGRRCIDRPHPASWSFLLPGGGNYVPGPNGCAPAVYGFGQYLGQDPDPFIRQQLLKDPATGYTPIQN